MNESEMEEPEVHFLGVITDPKKRKRSHMGLSRLGHSGNSRILGRVIWVIKNSDYKNCYPKFI